MRLANFGLIAVLGAVLGSIGQVASMAMPPEKAYETGFLFGCACLGVALLLNRK